MGGFSGRGEEVIDIALGESIGRAKSIGFDGLIFRFVSWVEELIGKELKT